MGARHGAGQGSQYSAWRARRKAALWAAATEPLVRAQLGFPPPRPMAIPSNHPATGLEGSQLGEELAPENVTGCAASPAPPEKISLRDGEKIGDLMLV